MGAKGTKLTRPQTEQDNDLLYKGWNESLGRCPNCGHAPINISIQRNAGNKNRVIPYYDYDSKFFNFKCGKCLKSWHSKKLG